MVKSLLVENTALIPSRYRSVIYFSCFAALLLLALALRLHHLDYESLYMDELHQISYYPLSFKEIFFNSAWQQQPPLDYWIGHFVLQFADSDFAIRLPASIFGVGVVFFITLLVSHLCIKPVALGTGLIAALLPFNIYYSQEARPYSIAIFFMLGVLLVLHSLLKSREKSWLKVFILLLMATCFLYSRALSPMVVTIALVVILIGYYCLLVYREGWCFSNKQGRIVFACLAFVSALIIYFPQVMIILSKGKKYVPDTSFQFEIESLMKVFTAYDLLPIWRAFIVQAHPLGLVVLVLLIFSPLFFLKSRHQWNPLWMMIAILLPCASILTILIFQVKLHMPLRPPYAIYLLPLSLIIAATTFQSIWDLAGNMRASLFIRFFLCLMAIFLVVSTVNSTINLKSKRKKTDWRGLTAYLNNTFDSSHVFLFDSLSNYGNWEPTFYGFSRYYKGKSNLIPIKWVPFQYREMVGLSKEPVIILFQWREYYLTSFSEYPINSVPSAFLKDIKYERLTMDPELTIKEFTGFSVIRLKKTSNELAKDTYKLINTLLCYLPQNSSLAELYLAAAGLSKGIGISDTHYWLEQALLVVSERDRPKIAEIGELISSEP